MNENLAFGIFLVLLIAIIAAPIIGTAREEISEAQYTEVTEIINDNPDLFTQAYIDDMLEDGKISKFEYFDVTTIVEKASFIRAKRDSIKELENAR